MDHVLHQCKPECLGCMYCDGGLAFCVICKEGEAGLEVTCPGVKGIEIQRRNNPLVESWAIWYKQKRVGGIVKSLGIYIVTRNKVIKGKEVIEIATRRTSFLEARNFVLSGGRL